MLVHYRRFIITFMCIIFLAISGDIFHHSRHILYQLCLLLSGSGSLGELGDRKSPLKYKEALMKQLSNPVSDHKDFQSNFPKPQYNHYSTTSTCSVVTKEKNNPVTHFCAKYQQNRAQFPNKLWWWKGLNDNLQRSAKHSIFRNLVKYMMLMKYWSSC